MFGACGMNLEHIVDSNSLFDKISTFRQKWQYGLRTALDQLKTSLETIDIYTTRWVRGNDNAFYALTKRHFDIWEKLNIMMTEGIWTVGISNEKYHYYAHWGKVVHSPFWNYRTGVKVVRNTSSHCKAKL